LTRISWNNDINSYPAVIVKVTGTADTIQVLPSITSKPPISFVVRPFFSSILTSSRIQAVKFAKENGLKVSMKGGGHSLSGSSIFEGGLLVDGSALRQVDVDPIVPSFTLSPSPSSFYPSIFIHPFCGISLFNLIQSPLVLISRSIVEDGDGPSGVDLG